MSRANRRVTVAALAVLALASVGVVTTAVVQAATIVTVTTEADEVDPSDGVVSLREAVDQANAANQPVTIVLSYLGVYDLTMCTPPVGQPPLNHAGALELRTAQPVTFTNGGHLHQRCPDQPVITTSDPGGNTTGALTLDGQELFGGTGADGGAVLARGSLSLRNAAVRYNVSRELTAVGTAAAVFVTGSGDVNIDNTEISGNSGAGLTAATSGAVTGHRAQIFANQYPAGRAAGIIADGDVTLDSSTLSNNQTTTGAAGGIDLGGGTATLHLTGSSLDGNTSGSGCGGVHANVDGGSSAFSHNEGPIAGAVCGHVDLDHTMFRWNGSQQGDAIHGGGTVRHTTFEGQDPNICCGPTVVVTPSETLTATDTVFVGQGGIAISGINTGNVGTGPGSLPHLDLTHVTIAQGGGIAFGPQPSNGSLRLAATAVGGFGTSCSLNGASVTSDGDNFAQDGSCGVGSGVRDRANAGDPLVSPSDGGVSVPGVPLIGSPLRDTIPNGSTYCTGTSPSGVARPQGPGCDVGANEAALEGFYAIKPFRALDTRNEKHGIRAGDPPHIVGLQPPGGPYFPKGGVALNVTVTGATKPSHLTVWPGGQAMPATSNLNFGPGDTIANHVVVAVGFEGQDAAIKIANNDGEVQVIVDVEGYFDTGHSGLPVVPQAAGVPGPVCPCGDGFVPLPAPVRAVDTRVSGTPPAYLGAVRLGGVNGVPAKADSVVANVTVVQHPWDHGYVNIGVPFEAEPPTSLVNAGPSQVIANLAVLRIGVAGYVQVFDHGIGDLIIDVIGYHTSAPTAARFVPVAPVRLMDTRNGTGGPAVALGPGETRDLVVSGVAGVPAGATAVSLNVTAVDPSAATHLTVWPTGEALPATSNLNVPAHRTQPNAVVARVGANGMISIRNNAGTTNVVVDLAGWYG